MQENSAETPVSKKNTFDTVKEILPLFLNFTAFIAVGGFMVIQSYLLRYTRLFTYNVGLPQYLTAGITLLLFLFIVIVLPVILASLVSSSVMYFLKKLAALLSPTESNVIRYMVNEVRSDFLRVLLILVPIALLAGFTFGYTSYPTIPRLLGGGMPADVILVFKDNVNSMGLPFIENTSQPKRSPKVKLLLELSDSVLIYDESQRIAIAVKNDALTAIMDAEPMPASPTPAATITATPTVTATASPTATP